MKMASKMSISLLDAAKGSGNLLATLLNPSLLLEDIFPLLADL